MGIMSMDIQMLNHVRHISIHFGETIMKSFLTTMLTASKQSTKLTPHQKKMFVAANKEAPKHPRLVHIAMNIVAHRYERDTGNEIGNVDAFDWSSILEWIVANLPMILSLLMMLFGI